ncbi:MAG: ABC transporter permease [Chitinophagaceae bacterium]|nr:MAG: ABC transporter permease [Chitinophagaceae bacterium]
MNTAWFISKKIAFSRDKKFSAFIIKIAIASVALSLAVMIIATSMVRGFQNEISQKVFNYWGHIHITSLGFSSSYQESPISIDQGFYPNPSGFDEEISHIQIYANKAGLLKTDENLEGLVLKGVGADYRRSYVEDGIQSGIFPDFSTEELSSEILISEYTANRLQLEIGDDAIVYFIETPMRVRRFQVSGIYKSGIREFDQYYAFVDIRHIQRLNNWDADQIGGFEIFINDIRKLDEIEERIYYEWLTTDLNSYTIKQLYPNIFDWLSLQSTNEKVIIILMIIVALINMSTAILILVMERTNMVGLLKALGADNFKIQQIFLHFAAIILVIGLLIGNVLGISFTLLQSTFKFIRLPEEAYYLAYAPVDLHLPSILLLNVGTLVFCVILLLLPSLIIKTITPVKALRWK